VRTSDALTIADPAASVDMKTSVSPLLWTNFPAFTTNNGC